MFPLHDSCLKSDARIKIKLRFDEETWHETTAHFCGLGSFKSSEDYFFFRDSLSNASYYVRFDDIVAVVLIDDE